MADGLFYNLGRKMGPKVRKARWMWESLAGTEADAIRVEHGVGLDLAHEARKQLQMDLDPRTRDLLEDTGYRLSSCVANQLRSFRFEAFQGGQPNAFALPGGFIFISRPLIELCQWHKDQIAFVLAHEMAHVIRGHAIERIVTNSAVSVAARAAPVRGVLGGWLRTVGIRFLETAYSRDRELEADTLGVRLAQAAGCDPKAAIGLFSRLAELNKSPEPVTLGEYFSTHPTADERIANIRQFLQRRSAPKTG
jgi:beta-barrel assembly-enhancing protease